MRTKQSARPGVGGAGDDCELSWVFVPLVRPGTSQVLGLGTPLPAFPKKQCPEKRTRDWLDYQGHRW